MEDNFKKNKDKYYEQWGGRESQRGVDVRYLTID